MTVIGILGTIILSALSGLLYRAGGMGKEESAKPKWIPLWMRNTKFRDLGIPACMVLIMLLLGQYHWTLIICIGLMFAALTTYCDFVNKWFKVKDPGREYWWNWALHGFFVSLAMFPLIIVTGNWTGFMIRQFVVTVSTAVWSSYHDDVVWEEYGRGVISTITLPLLLL